MTQFDSQLYLSGDVPTDTQLEKYCKEVKGNLWARAHGNPNYQMDREKLEFNGKETHILLLKLHHAF